MAVGVVGAIGVDTPFFLKEKKYNLYKTAPNSYLCYYLIALVLLMRCL
jgi:hypothetical protein